MLKMSINDFDDELASVSTPRALSIIFSEDCSEEASQAHSPRQNLGKSDCVL